MMLVSVEQNLWYVAESTLPLNMDEYSTKHCLQVVRRMSLSMYLRPRSWRHLKPSPVKCALATECP